jgi:hypothetical protein
LARASAADADVGTGSFESRIAAVPFLLVALVILGQRRAAQRDQQQHRDGNYFSGSAHPLPPGSPVASTVENRSRGEIP